MPRNKNRMYINKQGPAFLGGKEKERVVLIKCLIFARVERCAWRGVV